MRPCASVKDSYISKWCFKNNARTKNQDRLLALPTRIAQRDHSGGNPGINIKAISHRYYLFEVRSVYELTKETIGLPLGCLRAERNVSWT